MNIKKLTATICLIFGIISIAQAQSSVEQMIKEWERAKAYTKEYLDVMPETGYALKPTPDMRSFADQMLHLTDGNYAFVSTVLGEQSPVGLGQSEKATDKSKANVTKLVMDGYDYVINSLKKLQADKLKENEKIFGRFDMTKGTALEKCFEHQTHHRGQTTVYIPTLRAKAADRLYFGVKRYCCV